MDAAATIQIEDCDLAYGRNADGLCHWCGHMPAVDDHWCSVQCRDAFIDAHVWSRARTAALRRSAWRCEYCGSRPVEVHHKAPAPDYRPGCQHHSGNLLVACRTHHRYEHRILTARPGEQLPLALTA